MSTLPVFFETRLVGRIEVRSDGPRFVYDTEWLRTHGAFPISATIPLSATPVPARVFLPWAANLLPEGRALRRIGELFQAAPEDVISILSEIGRDTAGALSIGAAGSTNFKDYREIASEDDLEKIINELPAKPFLAGEDGVSMSLAGVQTKLGVRLLEIGRLAVPINGSPSTHILKPDSAEFAGSVQNEAFCLTLARLCGLKTTSTTTGRAGQRTYLLVERYDRLFSQQRWRRVHQEDFCQALGKPPEAKYEFNQTGIRGPTALEMIDIARNTMKGPDVIALLDYLIFNIVVCNTDAHAKNYSSLISATRTTLAPIYDVICTQVWQGITSNLSQAIADKRKGDHLKRRHWETFAEAAGFNATSVIKRIQSILSRVEEKIPEARRTVAAMPAGDDIILELVQSTIYNRVERLRNGLSEEAMISDTVVANIDSATALTRGDYVKALRSARSPTSFKKAVKKLQQDKTMTASDVRQIASDVLAQKFSSKKRALEALANADRSVPSLLS